jgi:hypothetical protein
MLAGSLSMGAMFTGLPLGGEGGGGLSLFWPTYVAAYKSKIQIKERQPLVGYVYYVSQADKRSI